jgi:SAM-dependent methyltransferase
MYHVPESMKTRLEQIYKDQYELFLPHQAIDVFVPMLLYRISQIYKPGGTVVDLGGGNDIANGVLAENGMHVYVVDMLDAYFQMSESSRSVQAEKEFLENMGVNYIEADLIKTNLTDHFEEGSVDFVTSNHCLEHLHESPRYLLESAVKVLSEDGKMNIEVPNAINLLKRFKVLFGKTNYTDYDKLYFSETYVGHIREYSTGDLKMLSRHLGFKRQSLAGRNWFGSLYEKFGVNLFSKTLDKLLQISPGLCGSLFLTLEKKDWT